MRPISDRGRAFPGGARRAPRGDARLAVPGPLTGGPRGEAGSRQGRRRMSRTSAGVGDAGAGTAAGPGTRTIRR